MGAVTALLIEIVLAVGSIMIGSAISDDQMKQSEKRNAHETNVRKLYQAAKNRFGVSIEQLNQLSDKMGLHFSQLKDAAQGSARLSRASKKLREYTLAYPGLVDKVNNIKNTLQSAINYLDKKEQEKASTIQSRGEVTMKDVAEDIIPTTNEVNTALSQVSDEPDTNTIDTSLVQGEINSTPEREKTSLEKLGESQAQKTNLDRPSYWIPFTDKVWTPGQGVHKIGDKH